MTSFWKFRPSALSSATNVCVSPSSRAVLEDHYEKDNERAIREGVKILPKSELKTSFRTLQWNINGGCFTGKHHVRSKKDIRAGIADAIRSADSDVVVLNECPDEKIFEKELKAAGYSYLDCATTTDHCPTAIATRLPVRERKEIRLSEERSALLVRVHVVDDDAFVWVIGTHLDFADGRQRQKEIKVLLKELEEMGILGDDNDTNNSTSRERIVLVGDLNQQRSQDYAPVEWVRIRSGMLYRRSCQDDGVSELLMDQGFACAWNNGDGNSKKHNDVKATRTNTNWETSHPPATHWTGTIVDYSYGRNISAVAVSISPAGWSDHRMTVRDWTCSYT